MCHQCKNTGWVVAESVKNKSLFGFRCGCAFGNKYARIIPEWNTRYKTDYHPDYEIPLPPEPKPVPKPKAPDYTSEDLPF